MSGAAPRWSVEARTRVTEWIGLGVTHVLVGYDHLAFVVGLLLVIAAGEIATRSSLVRSSRSAPLPSGTR